MPITVAEIAARIAGMVEGNAQHVISGANTIENAGANDLAFAANRKALEAAVKSQAGCVLVPASFEGKLAAVVIRVTEPRVGFARALELIYPRKRQTAGVHATAVVAASAQLGNNCFVGPHVCIGENTRVGDSCQIGAWLRDWRRCCHRRRLGVA